MNEYIIKDINTEGYDRFLLWLSLKVLWIILVA